MTQQINLIDETLRQGRDWANGVLVLSVLVCATLARLCRLHDLRRGTDRVLAVDGRLTRPLHGLRRDREIPGAVGPTLKPQVIVNSEAEVLLEQLPPLIFTRYLKFLRPLSPSKL